MRTSWDEYFMQLAMSARLRATCPRRQVGAVLVRDKLVKGTGYNGAPSSLPHCIDDGCDLVDGVCKRTLHAEANALAVPLSRRSGASLYTTDFPCPDCAERITHSGVVEVVYMIPYHTGEAETLALFADHGIIARRFVPAAFMIDHVAMVNSRQAYSEPDLWL